MKYIITIKQGSELYRNFTAATNNSSLFPTQMFMPLYASLSGVLYNGILIHIEEELKR